MKRRIKIIQITFFISTFLFSMSTEGTNVGLLMEKNKGAFAVSSNATITPQKPSSDKDIGNLRYLNASILLPSGISFSFGNSLEKNDRYSYLDFSYFIKKRSNYLFLFI